MASIDFERITKIAEFLKTQPEGEHLNFYSFNVGGQEKIADDMYPPLAESKKDVEQTIKFFFLWGLHNWGFWYGDTRGYLKPMYGLWNGKKVKGSELWSLMLTKAFLTDPDIVEPDYLAQISEDEFNKYFSDDNGPVVWPSLSHRLSLTSRYGSYFKSGTRFKSPVDIVDLANSSENPLNSFLRCVGMVGGYDLDAYKKRETLLAMALANRPEHFLNASTKSLRIRQRIFCALR